MTYDKNHALLACAIPGLPQKSGKVRDVFDLGDSLLTLSYGLKSSQEPDEKSAGGAKG